MITKKDGGPAFPQHGWSSDAETVRRMSSQSGMTLRDWFAGMAITGLMHEEMTRVGTIAFEDGWDDYLHLAKQVYLLADAMLAERAKAEGT